MKALRFFFLSLLAAFSFAASAQTIEVYKDGRIIDSFTAAQVDSVVYSPTAAQPRYYYYAGWDCPTSVEELESKGFEINGYQQMESNTTIYSFLEHIKDSKDELGVSTLAHYYVIIPNGSEVWDDISNCESAFNNIDLIADDSLIDNAGHIKYKGQLVNIDGYRVFISNTKSRKINAIKLIKR